MSSLLTHTWNPQIMDVFAYDEQRGQHSVLEVFESLVALIFDCRTGPDPRKS